MNEPITWCAWLIISAGCWVPGHAHLTLNFTAGHVTGGLHLAHRQPPYQPIESLCFSDWVPVDYISGCLIYRWIAVSLVEGKSASLHCIDGSGGRRGTCPMASSPIAGDPGYATSLYLTGWSVNGLTESH